VTSKQNAGCVGILVSVFLAMILSNPLCLALIFSDGKPAMAAVPVEFKWIGAILGNVLSIITASIAYAVTPYFISTKDRVVESPAVLWLMRLVPTVTTYAITLVLIGAVVPMVLTALTKAK